MGIDILTMLAGLLASLPYEVRPSMIKNCNVTFESAAAALEVATQLLSRRFNIFQQLLGRAAGRLPRETFHQAENRIGHRRTTERESTAALVGFAACPRELVAMRWLHHSQNEGTIDQLGP